MQGLNRLMWFPNKTQHFYISLFFHPFSFGSLKLFSVLSVIILIQVLYLEL
jgi:hypothetical protein